MLTIVIPTSKFSRYFFTCTRKKKRKKKERERTKYGRQRRKLILLVATDATIRLYSTV